MNVGEFFKNFGVLIAFCLSAWWYYHTKKIEKIAQRKALAAALLAEITTIIILYKELELEEWDETKYQNIQSLEEEYMTIYNKSSDKISLFSLDEVSKIVTFYTYLKAHFDTLRFLVKVQNEYNYLIAAIHIFGNLGNISEVLSSSLRKYKSTHNYALDSQAELYARMGDAEDILKDYLREEKSRYKIFSPYAMDMINNIELPKTWTLLLTILMFISVASFYIYLDVSGILKQFLSGWLYVALWIVLALCMAISILGGAELISRSRKNIKERNKTTPAG